MDKRPHGAALYAQTEEGSPVQIREKELEVGTVKYGASRLRPKGNKPSHPIQAAVPRHKAAVSAY